MASGSIVPTRPRPSGNRCLDLVFSEARQVQTKDTRSASPTAGNLVQLRRRRVIRSAPRPRPSRAKPPFASLVLQPPPPLSAPGQHTPPVPPEEMQPKPDGQPFISGLQFSTQYELPVPSLPHWPDLQSVFFVHVEPRPPVTPSPATQRPSTQVSVSLAQSPGFLHAAPIVIE